MISGVAGSRVEDRFDRLSGCVHSGGWTVARGPRRKGRASPFTKPIPATRFSVNEADQGWVDGKMTPQSTACFTEKIKVTGAYQRMARKTYIRAKNFAGFAATLERIRRDASWKTHIVDCGHDVMIDKPDELASILVA